MYNKIDGGSMNNLRIIFSFITLFFTVSFLISTDNINITVNTNFIEYEENIALLKLSLRVANAINLNAANELAAHRRK